MEFQSNIVVSASPYVNQPDRKNKLLKRASSLFALGRAASKLKVGRQPEGASLLSSSSWIDADERDVFVAPGYADVMVTAKLQRQSASAKWQFRFKGPRDLAKPTGIFISEVTAAIPLGLRTAQRVLDCNGINCRRLSRREFSQLISTATELNMTLRYDPAGYTLHDDGHELRQLGKQAFLDADPLLLQPTLSMSYYGSVQLPHDSSRQEVADTFNSRYYVNRNTLQKHMSYQLSPLCVSWANTKSTNVDSSKIELVDVDDCFVCGPVMAVVVGGVQQVARAHYLRFKSNKKAEKAAEMINQRRKLAYKIIKAKLGMMDQTSSEA